MKITKKIIVEKPGPGRLGRHIEHDPQSRAFSVGTPAIKTVTYKRHGKPFDQRETWDPALGMQWLGYS
jgi:hypothetical protein